MTATVVPAPAGVRPGLAGASPVSGVVTVRLPGTSRFVRLKPGQLIPTGAELDTTHGKVRLFVASNAHGGIQTAELYTGRFIFRQSGRVRPRTTFVLSQPLTGCARGNPPTKGTLNARRRARRPTKRQIWVTEQGGNFNTRGTYVGTSVQGTTWLTADTCTKSTVRVKQGVVIVHDFIHHRTIKLHAGQTYTAQKTAPPPATVTAHLYWANVDGTIVEANLNGTGAKTIANGQGAPKGVAVSGGHLYWASPAAGTITRGQPERHGRQDDRQRAELRVRGGGQRQPPVLGQ